MLHVSLPPTTQSTIPWFWHCTLQSSEKFLNLPTSYIYPKEILYLDMFQHILTLGPNFVSRRIESCE